MKAVGMTAVIVGFALLGSLLSQNFIMRKTKLQKISVMISDIKTRLEYSCPSVDELIFDLSNKSDLFYLLFLKSCVQYLKRGIPFPSAWENSLKDSKNVKHLKKDDVENLLSLGSVLGTTDLDGQRAALDLYKNIIDDKFLEAQESAKKYSKLCVPLSVLLGITLIILII